MAIDKVKSTYTLGSKTIRLDDPDHFYRWLEGVVSRKDISANVKGEVRRYARKHSGKVSEL